MDRRDLERLGHHVVSRRVALGYRNRTDLAASLQFTVRTLGRHRARRAQGQRGHLRHPGKQAGLGTGQHRHHPRRWGTQRNRGRTAPPHPNPLAPTSATDALARASTEELLLELRRRIIAPRNRHHEIGDDWDGGLTRTAAGPNRG